MPGQSFITWRLVAVTLLLVVASFLASPPSGGPAMLAGEVVGAVVTIGLAVVAVKAVWVGFWHVVDRVSGGGETTA